MFIPTFTHQFVIGFVRFPDLNYECGNIRVLPVCAKRCRDLSERKKWNGVGVILKGHGRVESLADVVFVLHPKRYYKRRC